ncbi:hypothetical protein LOAG_12807 [Loa loa]|uniref:Uncharacterized protein n=1 Tax=Loa loa TaxID=7209 RepID=A0A1S0TLM9_LOALO|nr:hypothetical protein LOAG_12807 [Loa loa]EFO15702.1 hypothetical protein LOAG_12807 [Loa loa]
MEVRWLNSVKKSCISDNVCYMSNIAESKTACKSVKDVKIDVFCLWEEEGSEIHGEREAFPRSVSYIGFLNHEDHAKPPSLKKYNWEALGNSSSTMHKLLQKFKIKILSGDNSAQS